MKMFQSEPPEKEDNDIFGNWIEDEPERDEYNGTVTCPGCGAQTPDVEAGMGYICCDSCGKTFRS